MEHIPNLVVAGKGKRRGQVTDPHVRKLSGKVKELVKQGFKQRMICEWLDSNKGFGPPSRVKWRALGWLGGFDNKYYHHSVVVRISNLANKA